MDWSLAEQAEAVTDVAAGLEVFRNEIPDAEAEISGSITILLDIAGALRALHRELDLDLARYRRLLGTIERDLDLVMRSLDLTLSAVKGMFGRSAQRRYRTAYAGIPLYPELWDDLCREFEIDEGLSLRPRLERYHSFIRGIIYALRGIVPEEDMNYLRNRINWLLGRQESQELEIPFNQLSIAPPEPRTPTSPLIYQTYRHVNPPTPLHPPLPGGWSSSYFPAQAPYVPPQVPRPPGIPPSLSISTDSAETYSSMPTISTQSSNNNNDNHRPRHWARKIFDGRHGATRFRNTAGQANKCLGRHEPAAYEELRTGGFVKVFDDSFDGGETNVAIYWRPSDHRARVLYVTRERARVVHCCMPLTALCARRAECCLQLCRISREDGELELWANLRFPTFERMVLFYLTFVAMKRQDWTPPHQGLNDWFPGEKEEFGGVTEDDGYQHAFRIWRDRDSGCVRLEATAHRGPMKTTPIWTAFVTQYIGSRTWMTRLGSKVIEFMDLHPYVFTNGYKPPRGLGGRFELRFLTRHDCDCFMETFQAIRIR
ncbi:hypothetical protein W97_03823 [Coniosporium apollinis CBS 100218]|uniref:Uncharacterized protein n=1 Tax=Coniosporium apollinis (strain CBS 100218) TaxID=1168221 RepID=R7YRS8_CONA1|nr:uncharacterized protein W97_03823 [Coniosporium apollinis CBS 100218]EON64590.1 hypothetical protein W97_03823 [Coniosporium apollinis CBS 100218]